MIAAAAASRKLARPLVSNVQQRRNFIGWMTNYPDKTNEMKKAHMAGGRTVFTWLKHSGDLEVAALGAGLATIGLVQLVVGIYRLATGKGKLD